MTSSKLPGIDTIIHLSYVKQRKLVIVETLHINCKCIKIKLLNTGN